MTDLAASALNLSGDPTEHSARVLTPDAIEFLRRLHDEFEPIRARLLAARAERHRRLEAGERLDFLSDTESVRKGDWHVASAPPRPRRPTSRDHRSGRPKDDDQRAQLRR